jgi:hypothetical protein
VCVGRLGVAVARDNVLSNLDGESCLRKRGVGPFEEGE